MPFSEREDVRGGTQPAVGSGGEVGSAIPIVSDNGDWGGVQGWRSKGYLSTRGSYWILMQSGAQTPKRTKDLGREQ